MTISAPGCIVPRLFCRPLTGADPLANSRQAAKRARQGEKRRQHNASLRSRMRTYLKKAGNAAEAGDKAAAEAAYREALPLIDSAAGKNIIHANKAARHKSRINAKIRALSS